MNETKTFSPIGVFDWLKTQALFVPEAAIVLEWLKMPNRPREPKPYLLRARVAGDTIRDLIEALQQLDPDLKHGVEEVVRENGWVGGLGDPHFCPKCGRIVDSFYDKTCDGCFEDAQIAAEAARYAAEAARYAAAEKIPAENYDGWVYLDDQDKFYESVADFRDLYWHDADDEESRPTYVWACLSEPIVNCSIDDLQIGENNAYEEFEVEDCAGLVELEEALAKFNKLNESLLVYRPDYKRAVVL